MLHNSIIICVLFNLLTSSRNLIKLEIKIDDFVSKDSYQQNGVNEITFDMDVKQIGFQKLTDFVSINLSKTQMLTICFNVQHIL